MEIRTHIPQPQKRRAAVRAIAPRGPQERHVRDAMRRLYDHRFAVPVVTPLPPSAPKQSGDW